MRKILAVVAAVLVLAGCNSDSDTEFLEASWNLMDTSQRETLCIVWELDPDPIVGSVFEHLPEHVDLSRGDAVGFYDNKCPSPLRDY